MTTNERIELAKEMAIERNATFVDSTYRMLEKKILVLVKVPGMKDPYLKKIKEHQLLVWDNTKTGLLPVNVPSHYRRGILVEGEKEEKRMITKRYFINAGNIGETILAEVEVVEKTNSNDEKSLTINIVEIIDEENNILPEWVLKIGSDKRERDNEVAIPGSNKVIYFKPIIRKA